VQQGTNGDAGKQADHDLPDQRDTGRVHRNASFEINDF
jgi:hypothetical protein